MAACCLVRSVKWSYRCERPGGEVATEASSSTRQTAYGFRTLRGVKIALFHRLGALPEPEFAHEFC